MIERHLSTVDWEWEEDNRFSIDGEEVVFTVY